ncbi:MAG TPA: metallopeptidase family protein [Caldisericia bacterium]|nr:metallopeptidase family protein [Caldisericia bacterium]HPO28898.1 metallopeptidase family protein [Caldisericia bacterium]HQG82143.1 metallopeptidase family protein [Caldisericia bacterium]HXK70427.1 metallopeptidase family protein [Caldisericia bacterium]
MPEEKEESFRDYVEEAISLLPIKFKEKLKNVAIFVKDYPEKEFSAKDGLLLGLYEGIPNPLKGSLGYSFALPDKITLFSENIKKIAAVRNIKMSEIIKEVLYHEIAHHFGFTEEELRR